MGGERERKGEWEGRREEGVVGGKRDGDGEE